MALKLNSLRVPERLRQALPALLAIAVFLLSLFFAYNSQGLEYVRFNVDSVRPGSFLLTGVYDKAVTGSMPLYDTVTALSLNLGISPVVFLLAAWSGVYILVFSAASLLGGYWAGIFSLAAAGLFWPAGSWGCDTEQAFYTFFLLLSLALLILRRKEHTLKNNLLAGLAIGSSMLARTPLFLFPLLVAGFDWLSPAGRRRGPALRTLAFLAASYVLLLPGAFVRQHTTGKFALFDDRRAACNIITAARGSIYTMEGDYRKLAGLGPDDSATVFFMREVASAPFSYALSVARRLGAVFLFDPALFGLFLAALIVVRRREARRDFLLPAYFILIHSLLSVERRYFYPMLYLIPPLAIAALFPPRSGKDAPDVFSGKAVRALFWLSFCLVLAVDGLVLAYPGRSGDSFSREALRRAAVRFPGDRVIQDMQCNASLDAGEYPAYYACLEGYSRKFGDNVRAYFLQARVSPKPALLPLPRDLEMNCLIIRMLREFELGDRAAAVNSFSLAYARYGAEVNMLRGTPYQKDQEIQRQIRQDSNSFWDRYVYDPLLLWPPAGIAKILSGLEKSEGLTVKLKLLEYAAANVCGTGGMTSCLEKRDDVFSALARDIVAPRRAGLALLAKEAGDGRPAAAAYLRALAAHAPAAAGGMLYGEGIFEAELLRMTELRGIKEPGPALEKAGEALRLQERPFYYALRALFARESGRKDLFEKSLDALEPGLEAYPDLLRFLSGSKTAAGGAALARHLETLAELARPPANKEAAKAAGRSKELSDSAVEKMRSGDMKAAERLLQQALDADKHNPEAFMDLCFIRNGENKKDKALEACRSAAFAVYSDPARGTPGLMLLASEASLESYKLLLELGRRDEAFDMLRRCVERAPAYWPGLPAARKALAAQGGRTKK